MEDHDLFVRLLVKNQTRLFRFIIRFLPDAAEAEDLLQEVCLVLWKKWGKYDQQRDFYAWACGVARFEIWEALRKKGRRGLFVDQLHFDEMAERVIESSMDANYDDQRLAALKICLKRLRPNERELIQRRYSTDSSTKRFADDIGLSLSTAYKSLARIRRRLHSCIMSQLRCETHGA